MNKKMVMAIALVVLISCCIFSQEQGAFGYKIELGKDGFVYHGITSNKIFFIENNAVINNQTSYKDYNEISYYQSGSDMIMVLKGKGTVVEIVLRSILMINYSEKGINLYLP
jgi:hypothetical protein